jgi:hypothetical protein
VEELIVTLERSGPRRQGSANNNCVADHRLEEWTRSQPIRTVAEIALSFSLLETRPPFAFQAIASEASRLLRLGMPFSSIARHLGVSDKTVAKAIRRGRFGT